MDDPVRVGLVGAGPWATRFTASLLAAGPHTTLTAVWARRQDRAQELAAAHGAVAVAAYEDLLESCEAIAFAVPPDVQAELAAVAATAGLAVLLDKPIGLDLAQAERLAEAVTASGVVSQLILTNRYREAMRSFLDDAAGYGATAGRATFLGDGSIPGRYFATPWRLEHGALLDLGPHAFDALDVTLGAIVDVRATGDPLGVVAMTCTHETGAVSQALLSATTPVDPSGLVVELFGPNGRLTFDSAAGDDGEQRSAFGGAMATIAAEFAGAVRSGTAHRLDVLRGLYLQRLIDTAATQLSRAS
jgi:predicted dehydrogenase